MDQTQRFLKIEEDIKNLSGAKIRYEERFKSVKEKLETLLADVRKKGYDPTKLSEIRDAKSKELDKILTELEKSIIDTTSQIQSIEAGNNA